MTDTLLKTVLVTGGAGYVGSALVPVLLQEGYQVKVLDLYLYGDDVLPPIREHPNLQEIKGDIRDRKLLEKVVPGSDAVIHLACISNDPSFELDPELGKSINYDAFVQLVKVAKDGGVKRFIYASSSSVYGIKDDENVTEDLPLKPLTDYSMYKAQCEEVLEDEREPGFTTLTLRPATVCGYAPRLRLDVIVNILTNHAVTTGVVRVFGGEQKRPNIHIDDMVELYLESLRWPDERIDGEVFNAGYGNQRIREIADIVRGVVGPEVRIETTPTNDHRSYRISSAKLGNRLGFAPKRGIDDAVRGLVDAFRAGKVPNSMTDPRYYNIKTMQKLELR